MVACCLLYIINRATLLSTALYFCQHYYYQQLPSTVLPTKCPVYGGLYTIKIQGFEFHTIKFCTNVAPHMRSIKWHTYVVHIWPPHVNCKQFSRMWYMFTEHINIMKSALDIMIIWCLFYLCCMAISYVDHIQTESIICPICNTFWFCCLLIDITLITKTPAPVPLDSTIPLIIQ